MQILDAIQRPGGWRALVQSRPRSITSFRIVSRLRELVAEFGTIIDGGANVGQFARAAHNAYPNATILSFEPLPDLARTLAANLRDVATHEVFEAALGSVEGRVMLHRASNGQSSSILPLLNTGKEGLEGIREVEQVAVQVVTLDGMLRDRPLTPPVLLKLDLQGYELEALKGAKQLLGKCSHVLVESVLERSYEREPLFDDISRFLGTAGFGCRGILNVEENRRRHIVQIDALFCPSALSITER